MASKNVRYCILMRAYAGAGKSTKARELADQFDATICAADDYWMKDGKYCFEADKLPLAHGECFEKFKKCVREGKNVIIDNTNLKFEDIQKYVDFLIINNNVSKFIYAADICEVTFNTIQQAIAHRTNRDDGKNIPIETMHTMAKLFKKINAQALFTSTYKNKIDFIFQRRTQANKFFENFFYEEPEKDAAIPTTQDLHEAKMIVLDSTEDTSTAIALGVFLHADVIAYSQDKVRYLKNVETPRNYEVDYIKESARQKFRRR